MLQALDFLAINRILHRDIKPDNILYDVDNTSKYSFKLTDFGWAAHTDEAQSLRAANRFTVAPEVAGRGQQSSKSDVWSLFVTMVLLLNARNFQETAKRFIKASQFQLEVLRIAVDGTNIMSPVREMAIPISEKRCSAAQILLKYFHGKGLTTPRTDIPPMIPWSDDFVQQYLKSLQHPGTKRLHSEKDDDEAANSQVIEHHRIAAVAQQYLVHPRVKRLRSSGQYHMTNYHRRNAVGDFTVPKPRPTSILTNFMRNRTHWPWGFGTQTTKHFQTNPDIIHKDLPKTLKTVHETPKPQHPPPTFAADPGTRTRQDPAEFDSQKTLIGADSKEVVVARFYKHAEVSRDTNRSFPSDSAGPSLPSSLPCTWPRSNR
ncbi:kinase-like domain-containing protein [Xylariaceae sp. FL0255]|nr:kinase-like domain-containing protein [Xylariaceae sp. FL0255]